MDINRSFEDSLNPNKRYGLDDNGINIGVFLRGNDMELTEMYMSRRVRLYDSKPEEYKDSEHWIKRLFTYKEYINWHDGKNQELLDELSRRLFGFSSGYDKSYRGYCQCIRTVSQIHCPEVAEFFYNELSVIIPEEARKKHTYIVGSTGSGKSTIMEQMFIDDVNNGNGAVVMIDPKGDLARKLARSKMFAPGGKHHDRLVYIHPTLYKDVVPKINPFDQVSDVRLAVKEMKQILKAVFKEMGESSEFSGAMESMLDSCLVLAYYYKLNLADIYRMMDTGKAGVASKKEAEKLISLADGLPSEFEFTKNYFQYNFNNVIQGTKQGIEWRIAAMIQDYVFQRTTSGKSKIRLNELFDRKMVIIVNLSKGELGAGVSSLLGKYFISAAQLIAQRRSTLEQKDRIPVWLHIDEFQNYVTESAEYMFTEGRGLGIHLNVAQQTVGQKMDEPFLKMIMTNTNTKIVARSVLLP